MCQSCIDTWRVYDAKKLQDGAGSEKLYDILISFMYKKHILPIIKTI